MKNHIVITPDGWVYVLTPDNQYGLGDINVDVDISDLREKKRHKITPDLIQSMKKSGMSVLQIAKELSVSRQTIYTAIK
jgi:DNA invertase Pin-like site-specific DNA recombinase